MSDPRFTRQMSVAPDEKVDGRYRAELSDAWNCPLVPQGGIVTALASYAMATALDAPDQTLRSVTTVFAAQVPAGPADVDVRVLRRGRSMSQARATVHAPGSAAGHTSIAVFGAPRAGFEFTDVRMPDVPEPLACPSWRDEVPERPEERLHFNFWDNVEGRAASGHAPWEDYVPTTSERSTWYRFDEPPLTDAGTWHPLALVALCDTMPGAVGERMGPGDDSWLPPSADLTVHLFADARSEWILGRNRARHAGDGYASVEMELWDAGGALVAYATQVMFFSFPDGPPPPERRRPPTP